MQVGKDCADNYLQDPEITRIIKSARDILKTSKTQEKKTLKLFYSAWKSERAWTIDIPLDI